MIFTPIKLVLSLIGGIVGVVVVVVVVVVVMAFVGSPGECDSGGRDVQVSSALAAQLQAKLDDFDDQLDAGQAASITFDESEATSRGQEYLDDKDAPIEDVKICFNPQGPSASGKVTVVGGLNLDVKVSGTVDLSGDHLRVEDLDIDVGQVPGFLPGGLEGLVEDVINDQLDDIGSEHRLSITFGAGTATLSGQP